MTRPINGANRTLEDPSQDPVYQMYAAAVDRSVTTVMRAAEDSGEAPPGAIIAGTVYALARYVLETIQAVPTVRNALAVIIPSLNRATEDLAVKGVERRAASPSAPELPD